MKTDGFRTCVSLLTICFVVIQILVWLAGMAGIESYTILSGSMEPVLKVGDIVLVDTRACDASPNEMIAFHAGGQVVIHRVVYTNEYGDYITKGDANAEEDFDPVQAEEMIGTVKAKLRRWKWIWLFFHSNIRFGMIAGLVILNLLTAEYDKMDGDVLVGNG